TDHPVFSCSKIEQKQLNTWVSFQSAEQPLLGQFSVSGNSIASLVDPLVLCYPKAAAYRASAQQLGFGCEVMIALTADEKVGRAGAKISRHGA
ncbi:MAG: hypothetical protein KKG42_07625, partial [Gammaproteobacteria bacterium]|nr:hypothetical protein [Gammaproteobacteria bacterium]